MVNATEADAMCAELGGYTDWRLPTLMELTTLIPANRYPREFYGDLPRVTWSALDPRAFPEDITAFVTDYTYTIRFRPQSTRPTYWELLEGDAENCPRLDTVRISRH